jgi:hypothetical protein
MRAALGDFRNEGYALVRGVLGSDVLNPVRDLIARQVDLLARELYESGHVASLFAELPFDRRLAALYEGRQSGFRKWSGFLFSQQLFRLASAPPLLDLLECVLGPEITFHGDFQLVPKLPENAAQAYPWHQDTLYYGVEAQHMEVITVWIPLVDVDEDNGGLWVIPGSHRWGLVGAAKRADGFFYPLEDPELRAKSLPMRMTPGDVLLMTNLTFHASGINRGTTVRWSLDFGYSKTVDRLSLSAESRQSYDYMFGTLERIGRTPCILRSSNRSNVDSWEDWAERRRKGRPHMGP